MKTINSFLAIVLVLFIQGCINSNNQENNKCCKMYVNPVNVSASPGGLITLFLVLENNCDYTITGSINLVIPDGMTFKDVSGKEEEKKKFIKSLPFLNAMLCIGSHQWVSGWVIIEVSDSLKPGTEKTIKIITTCELDSMTHDISKKVIIK